MKLDIDEKEKSVLLDCIGLNKTRVRRNLLGQTEVTQAEAQYYSDLIDLFKKVNTLKD
jgi:hypothetical protein